MTALIAAIAARLGHIADQAAIANAYHRGYCAGETYNKRVINELETRIRDTEIENDRLEGENYDLNQRLAICDSAVIQLPEAS